MLRMHRKIERLLVFYPSGTQWKWTSFGLCPAEAFACDRLCRPLFDRSVSSNSFIRRLAHLIHRCFRSSASICPSNRAAIGKRRSSAYFRSRASANSRPRYQAHSFNSRLLGLTRPVGAQSSRLRWKTTPVQSVLVRLRHYSPIVVRGKPTESVFVKPAIVHTILE